jgi:hypothetical protein
MADTQKRIDELAESSEKARKAGRIRQSLSLPEDKRWDAPFSGVSLKSVYASRQAASDKLQNLRDEETEALTQRQKMEKSKEGKAKGGSIFGRPGDEKTLEGGGGGGGGGSGKLSPLAYIPPAVGLGGMGFIKKKQIEIAQEAGDKDRREAKYEMKRETRGMAKGGSVSARADGCAQRGKTKGRIV